MRKINYREPKYDEQGRPICNICGKAFKQLLKHVKNSHGMEPAAYKKRYRHNPRKGIISHDTRAALRACLPHDPKELSAHMAKIGGNTKFISAEQKEIRRIKEATPPVQTLIKSLDQSGKIKRRADAKDL